MAIQPYDQSSKSRIVLYVVDDDGTKRKVVIEPDITKDTGSSGDIKLSIPLSSGSLVTKEEIVNILNESGGGIKVDMSQYYTKKELETILKAATGADFTNYYTKEETVKLISGLYTNADIDGKLLQKVDTATLTSNYTNNVDLKKQMLEKVDKTAVDSLIEQENERFKQLTDDVAATEKTISDNYNGLIKAVTETKNELDGKISNIVTSLETTSKEVADKFTAMNKTITDNRTESLNKDKEHDQLVDSIKKMISTNASEDNKLIDKAYVDDLVRDNSSNGISSDADGNGFTSLDALKAGPWYSMGVSVNPSKNDYAVVKSDATHNGNDVRYNFDGAGWVFFQEFKSGGGGTDLNTAQLQAVNSGITETYVKLIVTNETNIKNEANTREEKDNELKQSVTDEATQRLENDNNIIVRLSKEETARNEGDLALSEKIAKVEENFTLADDGIKKLVNDNKLDIEKRVGSLTTLNTEVNSSVVDAINNVHDEIHNTRVAKTGDTMSGKLKIELASSGSLLELNAGNKGISLSMGADNGTLSILPVSLPDAGFEFTAFSVLPRSVKYSYSFGSELNKWNNVWTENINGIPIDNFIKREEFEQSTHLSTKPDGSFIWTQAEYDALTDAAKKNGKLYIIIG